MNTDKYKTLYEYMKNQYSEERERTSKLEEKAVRYFGTVTVAITGFVFLIRFAASDVIPPRGCVEWLIFLTMVLVFVSLASAWSAVFRCLALQRYKRMARGSETVELFNKNKYESVLLGLAKRYSEAADAIKTEYDKKLSLVNIAYGDIAFSAWGFVFFVLLVVVHKWISK